MFLKEMRSKELRNVLKKSKNLIEKLFPIGYNSKQIVNSLTSSFWVPTDYQKEEWRC